MARITRVAKARQRYATVAVIDADTGTYKTTPVMRQVRQRQPDGSFITVSEPKLTKTGRPVVMRVTTADKSQPLPMPTCDNCRTQIQVGAPYKHISPRSGPYGGRTLYRCGRCPDWQVWEYSNSLSARIAQVIHEAEAVTRETAPWEADRVQNAMSDAADALRSIAEDCTESAQNMEDGFGHPTALSEELVDRASAIEDWADEIERAGDGLPDSGEGYPCSTCDGEPTLTGDASTSDANYDPDDHCVDCGGYGYGNFDDWETLLEDALGILWECPV